MDGAADGLGVTQPDGVGAKAPYRRMIVDPDIGDPVELGLVADHDRQ
jgi:hypothetical protein